MIGPWVDPDTHGWVHHPRDDTDWNKLVADYGASPTSRLPTSSARRAQTAAERSSSRTATSTPTTAASTRPSGFTERFQQRLNIRGELIPLPQAEAMSDAAWALENLARVKQTLPNGYCGLPLQQPCRTPTPA